MASWEDKVVVPKYHKDIWYSRGGWSWSKHFSSCIGGQYIWIREKRDSSKSIESNIQHAMHSYPSEFELCQTEDITEDGFTMVVDIVRHIRGLLIWSCVEAIA